MAKARSSGERLLGETQFASCRPGSLLNIADLAGTFVFATERAMMAELPTVSAVIGDLICFTLRVVNVWQHWNLGKAIKYQR
ncbi:MAG TPA: hypothetical protein VLI93_00400 [Acetobacteraceae bacterium]|nr:hypothetical protein [Acetobacteraceae bacterium]